MPPKSHCRKRKTPFTNPFTGIQTRNRTQAFVNRTRSGRSRADPLARNLIPTFTNHKSIAFSLTPRVKDLRTRRIFTSDADSIPIEKEEMRDLLEVDKKNQMLHNLEMKNVDCLGQESNNNYNNKESDQVLNNEQISRNGLTSSTKTVVNLCKRRKVYSTPSSFSFKRMLPYLMETENDDSCGFKLEIHGEPLPCKMQKSGVVNSEANIIFKSVDYLEFDQQILSKVTCNEHKLGQTTPPNTDMLSKMEVGRCGETSLINNELTVNQIHDDLSGGNETRKDGSLKDSKCSTSLAVLKPCSRLRVYKNPKSVSYRRLHPFLMNMAKENSSVSRTNQHQATQLDSQNGTLTPFSTAEQNNIKETIADNCENEHLNDRGSDFNPESPNPAQCANIFSNMEPSSLTYESPPPLDNSSKPELVIPEIEISNLKELHIRNVSVEQFTPEELVSATKHKECFDVVEICNKNAEISFEKSSLKPKVYAATATPKDRPLRGILKRNPRGCRGPCNCLNCASFRLHADKAYEFSRNQLHDAEEIASDLMKELTMLRLMLEKAEVQENNLDIVHLNTVKEACKKAQETENLAKARLNQMNHDLNVHCRLPQLIEPVTNGRGCCHHRSYLLVVSEPITTE